MMDIDHFKVINDTHGNAAGDEVLRNLAGKLTGLLRNCDIIGRYGGEEFAVLMPETPLKTTVPIAERIRQSVENAVVRIEGVEDIKYTLSIGAAAFTKEIKTLSALIEEADKGLYEAKESGRNRVVVRKINIFDVNITACR